ncbi:MAG: HAMP domain-containing protein [Alphaproteobacteria bacterium]|nr:HAMP domain-containing protein [Alphaproteobacteria bacterium]MBF0392822.1 HAMP domain-containing protein [Alphaproteobacteria bacterium]
MSLFLRIWLLFTVVMTLAVLGGLAAYKIGTDRDLERARRGEALATAQLVAEVVAGAGEDVASRVRRLMLSGRFLAIAAFDHAGEPLVSVVPEHESLDFARRHTPEAARAVLAALVPTLIIEHDALHVAQPLFDDDGVARGVVAISLPRDTAGFGTQDRVLFALLSLAAVLPLAFGTSAMLARHIGGPIDVISDVACDLERGHLDARKVSALIGRRDEIGKLARTVLRLIRALDHVSTRMNDLVDHAIGQRERL